MATATLVPISITDTNANIASGTVANIDNTIASANDGALVTSIQNDWLPAAPGTATAVTFALSDLPGAATSINTVQFRVRGRRQGTAGGDQWGILFSVLGTNAPTTTAAWTEADGTTFSNKGAASPVASSATVAQSNSWTVQVYMNRWVKDKGFDNMYFDISEIEIIVDYNAATAPTISSPTASATGTTTGTGGFSTDTTTGTGYYYISTSATPPSATDLKNGTGAVDSGNSTVTASPHTFNFSGLSAGTTYYAHYIQNDTLDSNIITSSSFNTYAIISDSETFTVNMSESLSNVKTTLEAFTYNAQLNKVLAQYKDTDESINFISNLNYNSSISFQEALEFIISLTQQESNTKTAVASVNLQGVLDYIFSNILSGTKSITFGALLDKVVTAPKVTSESQTFATNLQMQEDAYIAVLGSVAFGINTAYAVSNIKAASAQISADIVLTQAEQVSKLLEDNVTFNYTLSFAGDPFGAGILDDPVYSAGNYIFVDLYNVLLGGTGIVTGSITFTNNMGQAQTVGLVGQAAATLLATLAQQQSAVKNTTGNVTYTTNLSEALSLARLVNFTANINMDMVPTNVATLLQSMLFDLSNSMDQTNVKVVDQTLNFDSILDATQFNELISNLSISFDASMQQANAVQHDLQAAITYLTQLNYGFYSGANEAITFNVNMLQTEAVRQILNPSLTLLANLTQIEQKQLVTSETLTFLTNLQQQQEAFVGILATISFAAQLSQTETAGLTINEAFNLIINMADSVNVQLDKLETITLLIQLADSYDKDRIIPITSIFTTNLDYTSTKLLDKLGTIVFATALQQVESGQVDFNALVTFATILTDFYIGDSSGAVVGIIQFAMSLAQNNVGISTLNDNITFSSLLDLLGVGGLDLSDNITLTANLDETTSVNLTKEGLVTFQSYYNKLIENQVDYRPSIDFDLQAIQTSAANKNTLASILLGIESNLITDGNRTIPAVINYGLSQGLDTEIRLVAEGTVTMTAQMQQSQALQMLGQAGITFGHLLGLSVLSGADTAESIAFGTVTNLSVSGFVLQFEVTTPDGRTFKVYFEDRITVVDEEERVITVYKKPEITIN